MGLGFHSYVKLSDAASNLLLAIQCDRAMKYQSFYYIGVYLGHSRIQFGYITYITYRIYIAIQYDTLQYKCKYTHKYNTIQYSTVQYSTIQYNTCVTYTYSGIYWCCMV